MLNIDTHFIIGCVGAFAPESLRLYNLRLQPNIQWSWGYIIFSIPFILIGGFIAWILEPTSNWAAFYCGLTSPILITTAMKNNIKAQKELNKIQFNLMEDNKNLKVNLDEIEEYLELCVKQLKEHNIEVPRRKLTKGLKAACTSGIKYQKKDIDISSSIVILKEKSHKKPLISMITALFQKFLKGL